MVRFKLGELLEKSGKTRYWLSQATGSSYDVLDNIINNTNASIYISTIDKIMEAFELEDIRDFMEYTKTN